MDWRHSAGSCGVGIPRLLESAKEGDPMTLHGHVKNGVVVFDDGASLPEGTFVQVTPLKRQLHQAQTPNNGLAAIYGKWPGDESDEEVERVLKELS